MSNKLYFKLDRLFNTQFQFIAVVSIIMGIAVIMEHYIVSGFLFILGTAIITGHNALNINLSEKTCHKYSWILFWKYGERYSFESIDNIFINSAVQTSKYYARVNIASTVRNKIFIGWLKFSNDKKVFLLEDKNKGKLMEKLKPIAESLPTTIVDTEGS